MISDSLPPACEASRRSSVDRLESCPSCRGTRASEAHDGSRRPHLRPPSIHPTTPHRAPHQADDVSQQAGPPNDGTAAPAATRTAPTRAAIPDRKPVREISHSEKRRRDLQQQLGKSDNLRATIKRFFEERVAGTPRTTAGGSLRRVRTVRCKTAGLTLILSRHFGSLGFSVESAHASARARVWISHQNQKIKENGFQPKK